MTKLDRLSAVRMIEISSISMRAGISAIQAMRIVDTGAAQIALVIDDDGRLVGTLTDGDIRRGLLCGETLDTPVERIMNRRFRSVKIGNDQTAALKIMREEGLRHIPVLDEEGRVVKLLLQEELIAPQQLPNTVVIMAGGMGKRLRPQTYRCPKPMLHVGGRPIIESILKQCIDSGFRKFYISVNYLKNQIIDYFQNGESWGVVIDYLIEEEAMGTAGCLQLLPNNIKDPFLVINGDILTRLNTKQVLNFHEEQGAAATLCVREHEIRIPFGVVETKGVELVTIVEKPIYRHLVNAGVYIIDPILLPILPGNGVFDMPTLLDKAKQLGHRVSVCPIHEYWLDIGRPETLRKANEEWAADDKGPL